jgi:hypothetical protein
MSDERHTVEPAAAIALAAAAGFDVTALERQLPNSTEALQAQIGELEKRIERMGAQAPEGQGTPAPAPHEQLAKRLNEAQSEWFSFGGANTGGSDGQAA